MTAAGSPIGRTLDPTLLRAQARLLLAQRDALTKYGRDGDPWAFVRDCVRTRDQATMQERAFPDLPYLEHVARRWQEHRLLALPKSRRMVLSWLLIALHTWLALFHEHATIGFMARKEGKNEAEGSNELVMRAKFIVDHLPPFLPRRTADYRPGYLRIPETGSEIIAIGEGPDQTRQLTFTAVLADEIGFWKDPMETWIALKPTIEGGGKITACSTANLGAWKQIVFDEL